MQPSLLAGVPASVGAWTARGRTDSTFGAGAYCLDSIDGQWWFADASLSVPAETPMLSRSALLLTILLVSLTAGCAHVAEPRDKTATKTPKLSKERQVLSEGYSILYQDARTFDVSELVLFVKAESDAMKKLVTSVADMAEQLKKDLERTSKDYPGVRIDLDPLPEMEKRKRKAIAMTRAKEFAPVVGKGGREYERTVLMSFANGLNHERHLCKVMAEAEPDAGLKKFLLETETKYDALYENAMKLLGKEYFVGG
jgi:hypothetical protein